MNTRLSAAILILVMTQVARADVSTSQPLSLSQITALEKYAHERRIVGGALLGCGAFNLAATIALGAVAGTFSSQANDHNDAGVAAIPFAIGAAISGLAGSALSIAGLALLDESAQARQNATVLKSQLRLSVSPDTSGATAKLAWVF